MLVAVKHAAAKKSQVFFDWCLLLLIVVVATGSRRVSRLGSFFLFGGFLFSLGFFRVTLGLSLLFFGLVITDVDLNFFNLLVTLQSETDIHETLERLTEDGGLFNCKSRLE